VRIALPTALIAVAVAAVAVLPAAGGSPRVGSAQYVVRPDPRACPSPLCGGYWVALANHSRTLCHDGLQRARCYVAEAVDERRDPLAVGISDGALARALLETRDFGGLGRLGVLVVADVRAPVGEGAGGRFYRLRDTGVRCIRAPCFSIRSVLLNRRSRVTLSGVDLSDARLTPEQEASAQAALHGRPGLFAAGRIVQAADGGRTFRAARVYLSARPRA
jgi:hypothetical protein